MNREERLNQIVQLGYDRFCAKVTGQRIEVSNEASLQLASIMKTLGELYEESPQERFNIELEKNVTLAKGSFVRAKPIRRRLIFGYL